MAIRNKRTRKPYAPPAYPLAHPELFYRLQPDIATACDELIAAGAQPTPEWVRQTVDRIHDGVTKRYPELAAEAREYERSAQAQDDGPIYLYGLQIQRGGVFRDLIAFLLLAELFSRRGRRR